MKHNKKIWRERWQSFWFRHVPPHAFAIVRIAFGAYLLLEAATYIPFVPQLFSVQALSVPVWSQHLPEAGRFLLELPSPAIAWLIAVVFCIACIGLMIGKAMRLSLIVLILLYLYYWQLSFHVFPSSYHRIYFVMMWLLLFSGADRTFSLRMKREKGSIFAWDPISIFPQRILAVQICATYLGVGLQKAWLPAWQDGAALSYSFINRWGTSAGRWLVGLNLPLWVYDAGVYIVKAFEFMLPIFLWMPRWRTVFIVLAAFFHIAIALLMSIWWFIALIPAYIVFYPPEDVYAWCKRRLPGRVT